MRVLLDNCVNHRFAELINGYDVLHARQKGWASLQNGELIAAAEKDGFSVIVTTDKQIQYQQNLKNRKISIIVLNSIRITLKHIAPPADKVNEVLEDLPEGSFIVIVS